MRVFAALSEACTQASQLHQASGAGTIRCDSEVYSHLGGRVRAREVDHDSRAFEITSLSPGGVRKAARPTPPDRAAIGGPKERLLQREGEYWTVAYLGSVFRLRATKGVDYLAHLLARPHRQLHVLDLLAHAEGVPPVDPSAGADVDGVRAAGEHELHIPALDDRARQAYCERIRDLQEVAEESRQLGNDERAARAESELFAVARELAAATGLGGRDRPAATAAERVRINVTRAIKATLGKVASLQPQLGHHLAASVRTGMFCSYAPPPGAPDAWRIST